MNPNLQHLPVGYETLPTQLREFAIAAKWHAEMKLLNIQIGVLSRQGGATRGFQDLVSRVARLTKSPHYAAIADLLTTVASVLGHEKEYSEGQLKQLAFRSRQR